MTSENSSESFEVIMGSALKLPGIKVDKKEFLAKSFSNHVSGDLLCKIVEQGPILANVDIAIINKIAKKLVSTRTITSSGASFVAGVPGGFAMAATIPADTLQFFGVALRLAQELGYLYGYEDFWDERGVNIDRVNGELVLFLGVMFGVGGSTAALKVLTSKASQQALKKIPNKALTKTIYYPVIKKIAAIIGVKMTKDTFAKGVSKVIPFVGGVVSGGLTFASMSKMGKRLMISLQITIDNNAKDLEKDFNELKKENPQIIDIEFEDLI
ncbi:bacteriochlorophyll 4-vinyl reductase [Bacillus thuringiensis]|uniref:bacteriochlorophyll 4-vinyl reductase n=1 Tax=Bacillus thuringiensis TaxID=1428 RepID=UPI000BF80AC0|nr:bacteriochlorophyll 4-vinyl reductase [Bacillus thuringiensis]PFC51162.1 bacteriochlorophyll 4-vinyl reductase [Bacillus thuringiensis]PGK65785.1 bacteriochlorophyll 4-vinyl reductase [Bacillus thuringiensis]